MNLIWPVAAVGLWAVVPLGSFKAPVPPITISPAESTVPVKSGDAFVASPKLLVCAASVRLPKTNQPLFAEFLIFNKFVEVSTQIL